jgi:hypothetical protein
MLAYGIICACVILVLLVLVLKAREVEHYNILFGGREFEVYLSPEFSGRMCEVSVYEVVHPHRKIFRTKYRCYKTFWLSDFETIKEGIYAIINSYLIDEEEENLIEAKWNEVEENEN